MVSSVDTIGAFNSGFESVNMHRPTTCAHRNTRPGMVATHQGLALVHFSAQPKSCLTQTHTLHNPKFPLTSLNSPKITLRRTPYTTNNAQVELKCGRV
jgi:hypothetical protein